jgi:hypothetical protein
MWSNFDFTELSKLGNQVTEAINKAKNDVESRIDNALGVPPTESTEASQNGDAVSGDLSSAQPAIHRSHPTRKLNAGVLPASCSCMIILLCYYATFDASELPWGSGSIQQKITRPPRVHLSSQPGCSNEELVQHWA